MVNGFKGEILIEDGEGNKYTFVLGMFSRVAVKQLTGEQFLSFWARSKEWSDEDVLNLFCAGMAMYHQDMSTREIAHLMDCLGPKRAGEIIMEAVKRASPDDEETTPTAEVAQGTTRPTPAKKRRPPAISM